MVDALFLAAAVCFILALRGLSSAETACRGNLFGIFGMILACVGAYLSINFLDMGFTLLAIAIGGGIGVYVARVVSITALPQMVAGFHSLIGLAAVLISFGAYYAPGLFRCACSSCNVAELGLGLAIGAVTFVGSAVAFMKLHGNCPNYRVPQMLNVFFGALVLSLFSYFVFTGSETALLLLAAFSLILGGTLVLPIGGADMPVVVSLLNSYSGWTASGIGFTIDNDLLIITGALVGASGAILSYIMCRGMNRSILDVIFGSVDRIESEDRLRISESRPIKCGSAEDAAMVLRNARSVIIVPGYGMATSRAQYALKEMADVLRNRGVGVKYAIHPVAGRMPGHMNVLLAEAGVSYEDVFELEAINGEFPSCDVAYVVGANDITNPAALNDPSCSIYGMPILEVGKAATVLFLKRSLGAGYAGVDNELFFASNTMMLLGDAKATTEDVIKVLRNSGR
ncbi:MAG: NAD(P)(+) transhydrogenase (Re/Si-specific) subunit beta [Holosporaceae bacterium]|jgi:NAD(P) transhydrogenase subunit beta|nr:NAD(P)(+) transhydrogenase (Re/Si-specific) subunit beta [Holosporaceae bacterium]